MSFSAEEKSLLREALQLYIQVASRQMPPEHLQELGLVVQDIATKIDQLGKSGNGDIGAKSPGITDEWYEAVCKTCPMLSSTGCTDKVTVKFPGKCDPILKYEKKKRIEAL